MTAFVIRGRQGGKTYAAVQWLEEDPEHRVIVTADAQRAESIREHYGLSASQVVTGEGLRNPGLPPRALEAAVDDAGELLAQALGIQVELVTASGDCGHGGQCAASPGVASPA